jgi:hypothetical protein
MGQERTGETWLASTRWRTARSVVTWIGDGSATATPMWTCGRESRMTCTDNLQAGSMWASQDYLLKPIGPRNVPILNCSEKCM